MIVTATLDGYAIHRANDTFVEDVRGLGAPDVRSVRSSAARRHGATDATTLYGPRIMQWRGWCGDAISTSAGPASAASAFDVLKQRLSIETSHLLVLRRPGRTADEQLVVRLASDVEAEYEGGGHLIRWSFDLVAPDPRFYGVVLNSAQRTGAGNIALTHDGTIGTPPLIEVVGPTNAGTLSFGLGGVSGATISLTGLPAMLAGSTLVADASSRTVTIDGVSVQGKLDAYASSWWMLPPGAQTVNTSGTALQAGTVTRVKWRSARI